MTERRPITPAGLKKLKEDLHRLKSVERPQNIRDIEEAREHGDLSENAEFQYAKERQSHIAGQMEFLEDQIARAEVIDVTRLKGDKIVFGATVVLYDVDDEREVTYKLVGPPEANAEQGMISVTSPIGKAIIGKKVNDEVEVRAPGGTRTYEIVEIRFE